jgi:hypothetical protein
MKRLREAERRKKTEGWRNKTWMLHHDNAPVHMSLLVCELLVEHEMTVAPQLPYSPDLAPADFLLFLKLKSNIRERTKLAKGPMRHPAKHVPGRIPELEKTLETMYKQWRGVL